ncbi:exocyst complex component Sec10-like protein [Lineolata rhizophorae]|uniref:Exocyst complex component Sec10-like protein n=1 Tax=Lineolata rhizophorae TaxID=578093 RepID=A0A6A6P6V1_9PEZI|nr:exocyst complex component Sec10-like protein [Lineolata rhizophorae]
MGPPPPGADTASLLSQSTSATSGGRLGGKGPVFSLDTFSSKDFIVKDFVEALSDSAVPVSRRSGGSGAQAFDPKPQIRTFEHALARLSSLSDELELHENELSASVRRAEAQHNQNVQSLGRKLELAVEQFHQLDKDLNSGGGRGSDVGYGGYGNSYGSGYGGRAAGAGGSGGDGGNVAMQIGEKLEELDRQRQRAQDAKFLIACWVEVSEKGSLSSLEDLRRMGGGDAKVRCAHIARQLLKISNRIYPEGSQQTNGATNGAQEEEPADGKRRKKKRGPRVNPREVIEKFLEMLEKDLLKQFDDFYRKQNFEGMRDCAIALRDFNDGASVMALFVNQHQFFIDRSQLITEEVSGDGETWDRLADPDTEPPGVEPSLQSLIDEVKLVVQEESFIIKRAFPFYDEVLVRFLQRVFQQSIQQRLEMVLEKATSISSLAYLRTLQSARSYIGALVDDLKSHGLTEHPEPVSSATATTLDQQLDDLFVPYLVGASYIDREKKNLGELYSSLLFKFSLYHERRRKMPTTYLGSLGQRGRELLSSARDAYMDRLDTSDLPASQKAMLLRIAGLSNTADAAAADAKAKEDLEVTEADGTLSLPNAKRMLKWLAEGVGRGLELSGGTETPKDVQALCGLLVEHLGNAYLETALDAVLDAATHPDPPKSEPDFSHLASLRTAVAILHLLQTSVNTVLLPLAAPNLTIRRDIAKNTGARIAALEAKISAVLHRTLDAALAWTAKLLAAQKKSDFRPSDRDVAASLDRLTTPTCGAVAAFADRCARDAARALDGANLSVFLTDLAVGLRALLLDHLRRFTVSAAGGLVVSKDVTKYVELGRGSGGGGLLKQEGEFAGGMEVLVEVANLFVVGPEALRERLRGEMGSELRAYVLRREDVGSVGVQAVLSSV